MQTHQPNFLVEVEPQKFFRGFAMNTTQPMLTAVPSQAVHLRYVDADQLVGVLMQTGFPHALVTNTLGEPCTADMLREYTDQERERVRAIRELDGLDLLAVLGTTAPDKLAKHMGISMLELRKRITIACQQVQEMREAIATR